MASASNSFPGGKNGAGVYQKLISLMPPHRVYIEPFLGGGSILLRKRLAEVNVGIDLDDRAIERFRQLVPPEIAMRVELECGDGIRFLRRSNLTRDTLVYLDPPYMMETRSSKRPIYRHHLNQDEFSPKQHARLLEYIKQLPCLVMISGYESEMYSRTLSHWRRAEFQTTNRAAERTREIVWMNYPEPLELHDYQFLGEGFRERERIKRKRARWRNRLLRMPAQERHALLATISELRSSLATSGDDGHH